MSTNKGTLVIAPVRPQDGADAYPSAFANEILGGHHQVSTIEQRDAISPERRVNGMLCTVTADTSTSPSGARTYQLQGGILNSNWVVFQTSGGDEGAQGPQGFQGAQGPQGFQGADGDQGERGLDGLPGSDGPQGAQGDSGRSMQVNAFGTGSILSDVEDATKSGPWGDGFSVESGKVRGYGYIVVDTTLALLYIKQSSTAGDWTTGIPFVPGPQGMTGAQGAQGSIGPVGSAGIPGSIGPQGAQGSDGSVGPRGDAGLDGATGPQGPQGHQGNSGSDGATGPQGANGDRGDAFTVNATSSDGERSSYADEGVNFTWLDTSAGKLYFKIGAAGVDTWSTGIDFGKGPQGYQGFQGNNGSKGDTGSSGPIGPQGFQGYQGHQGYQGYQGNKGDVGSTGSAGIPGSIGPQGYQGNVGATGPQGYQGFQGVPGTGSSGSGGGLNPTIEYKAVWDTTSGNEMSTVIRSSSRVHQATFTTSGSTVVVALQSQPFSAGDYVCVRNSAGTLIHGIVSSALTDSVTVTKTFSTDAFTASGDCYIQAAYGYYYIDTTGSKTTVMTSHVGGRVIGPSNPAVHGIKLHYLAVSSVARATAARPAPYTASTRASAFALYLPFGMYDGIYADTSAGTYMHAQMFPYVWAHFMETALTRITNFSSLQFSEADRKSMLIQFDNDAVAAVLCLMF